MLDGRHPHLDGHLRHEVVDRTPRAPLAQGSGRVARLVADDLPVVRLGHPALVAREPQGRAVHPDGVVIGGPQDNRTVSNLGIEPGRVKDSAGRKRVVESLAPDPWNLGVRPGPVANGPGDSLRVVMAANRRELLLEAAEDGVHMAVAEGVADEPALGVDDVVGRYRAR
ncbi:unannotated protein [freshwater metagenome]|uniref:Unannotated protein n=1 Tax=freshwater metagenome TaxID=449393 RepID=A0A6J7L5Y5_9ZZZZ